MERVGNSIKLMNTDMELFTLSCNEKTTLIVTTAILVKFMSIYDVRTHSVCHNCRSMYSYQWLRAQLRESIPKVAPFRDQL